MNLNLGSNPIVDELGYRSTVLRALPLIADLDFKPVTSGTETFPSLTFHTALNHVRFHLVFEVPL